jgi:hypothetical protein
MVNNMFEDHEDVKEHHCSSYLVYHEEILHQIKVRGSCNAERESIGSCIMEDIEGKTFQHNFKERHYQT